MSSPKVNPKIPPSSNNYEDVKKLLNRFFNDPEKADFKIYKELIFKLNEELFKNGSINPRYLNRNQFDLSEMKEYLELINDILEEKKQKIN